MPARIREKSNTTEFAEIAADVGAKLFVDIAHYAGLVAAGLSPEAKVGLYLYNSVEYCEVQFAAFKGRMVPINVNYRYLDDELLYLLENSDSEALFFHSSLGDRVARVNAGGPSNSRSVARISIPCNR